MASNNRRKRRDRKPNLPQQGMGRQPRKRAGALAGGGRGPIAVGEEVDLATTYSHVKRDLLRIAVLGSLLCLAIYGSQFVAL